MSDFFDEEEVRAPNAAQLGDLEKMINQAVSLRRHIETLEKQGKDLEKKLFRLMTMDIPGAMATAGVVKFTTKAGVKVEVNDELHGNLPREDIEKRKAALQWLTDNGGADIIKSVLELAFGRGQHNFKEQVKTILTEAEAEFNEKEDVHHSTLKAFAREKMEKGERIPLELLGLHAVRLAKIKVDKDD